VRNAYLAVWYLLSARHSPKSSQKKPAQKTLLATAWKRPTKRVCT
jgi:hypothetical protein